MCERWTNGCIDCFSLFLSFSYSLTAHCMHHDTRRVIGHSLVEVVYIPHSRKYVGAEAVPNRNLYYSLAFSTPYSPARSKIIRGVRSQARALGP